MMELPKRHATFPYGHVRDWQVTMCIACRQSAHGSIRGLQCRNEKDVIKDEELNRPVDMDRHSDLANSGRFVHVDLSLSAGVQLLQKLSKGTTVGAAVRLLQVCIKLTQLTDGVV